VAYEIVVKPSAQRDRRRRDPISAAYAAWDVSEESPFPTPNFRSMFSIRHHRVSADWKRFAPTNAANQSQFGFTQWASARLIRTKDPAINRIHLSMLMLDLRSNFHFALPVNPGCLLRGSGDPRLLESFSIDCRRSAAPRATVPPPTASPFRSCC